MKTLAFISVISLFFGMAFSEENTPVSSNWYGHDFVFCFVTDDGRLSNLAWADTARTMDFRFTIAINAKSHINPAADALTFQQIQELEEDGFEIACHGYSHGNLSLPETCPKPPKGSLMGYFLCENVDPVEAMAALHVEIERDSIAVHTGIDVTSIKTLAYPRHRHGKALIDSLISEGYIGARTGGWTQSELFSYGDFPLRARNGWDEGISLFRVPTRTSDYGLFGNHSADPPVHFTYEEFEAAALPRIQDIKQRKGILVIYTHHLGNDNDSYGNSTFSSGGITKQELAWLVTLVRENGGIVMPFGEAVSYYRSQTTMVTLNGDYVWMPDISAIENLPSNYRPLLSATPNPFNPQTVFEASILLPGDVNLDLFDTRGIRVRTLASGFLDSGQHQWTWDGRDDSGRYLAAGVYMAQLGTSGGLVTTKVLLLK